MSLQRSLRLALATWMFLVGTTPLLCHAHANGHRVHSHGRGEPIDLPAAPCSELAHVHLCFGLFELYLPNPLPCGGKNLMESEGPAAHLHSHASNADVEGKALAVDALSVAAPTWEPQAWSDSIARIRSCSSYTHPLLPRTGVLRA